MTESRSTKPRITVDQLLSDCTPDVRKLAESVRELVRRTIPTSTERAYPGWKGVGFRDPHAGYFLGMFPRADQLDLVFERGAELSDPTGVFAPKRDLRQVRFVEIRRLADVRRRALHDLIRQAVTHGSLR